MKYDYNYKSFQNSYFMINVYHVKQGCQLESFLIQKIEFHT